MGPKKKVRRRVVPAKSGVRAVAQAAGVSIATVSRVLNKPDSVNIEMRARVQEVAARLRYMPNSAAKALRMQRTRLIGAVIPTLDHAFFARMTNAFQEALVASGYMVLIITVGFDNSRIFEEVRQLIERGVEGLILVGRVEDASLSSLIKDRNLVALSTYSVNRSSSIPSVGFDNYRSMKQVVDYLLRLGHTRLAMIAGPTLGNDRQQDRIQAFHDARKERRIREAWHVHERSYTHALEDGASAMRQIHADYPDVTAVVCTSDTFAFGALSECRKLALKVPEQISIAGHDDLDFATFLDPNLTTISVPARQMGQIAAEKLIDALEHGEPLTSSTLDAELRVRGSTGRPRRA
jgi:LacI family transcriptional regulator, galactose operon repressor